MNSDRNQDRNAAAIEQDVMRTQDEIGETVEKLEDALNPSTVGRELLGEDGRAAAAGALEVIRRNPLPVALIAVGAVWLFAASDAPMIREIRRRLFEGGPSNRSDDRDSKGLRPRSAEPAPIGPPPVIGDEYDRALVSSGT